MSDRYGGDIITITDDDGKEYTLEHLDTIELDGTYYLAFVPADLDPKDPEYGIVLLCQEEEDGDVYFKPIADEEEESRIYDVFMEKLFGGEGDEEEEDGEN